MAEEYKYFVDNSDEYKTTWRYEVRDYHGARVVWNVGEMWIEGGWFPASTWLLDHVLAGVPETPVAELPRGVTP